MRRILTAAAIGLLVLSSLTFGPAGPPAKASSHREAPGTSRDPSVDATDVYVFRDPNNTNNVTLIMNFIPFQIPQGGPNFYNFDDNVVYAMRIDNNGDAVTDIQIQFRFKTVVRNDDTFLYNTGQVTGLTDSDLNVKQFYKVTIVRGNAPDTTMADFQAQAPAPGAPAGFPFQVAPPNIGVRSTPNYETNLGSRAVRGAFIPGFTATFFAGPRDEGFYIDLGSAFDLFGLRPFNTAHAVPLPTAPGVDGTAGLNVHTIAMQLPISMVTADGQIPGPSNPNRVISVYSAASRPAMTVLAEDRSGESTASGNLVQVSRLGNPLVNELFVPLRLKDRFNASLPGADAQFLDFFLKPEPARLIGPGDPVRAGNALLDAYPGVNTPPEPRKDVATIFLTGIPGLNVQQDTVGGGVMAYSGQPADTVPQERLRINLAIMPTPGTASEIGTANRLGFLGGDNAGFPNGRRVGDDVVDIELLVLAGATPFFPANSPFNMPPNDQLGDGVNTNDRPFLTRFPYLATPWSGYDSPTTNDDRGVGSTNTTITSPTPRPEPTPRP